MAVAALRSLPERLPVLGRPIANIRDRGMQLPSRRLVVGAIAVFALASSETALAQSLPVHFSEVHYHPGDDSREGEFVEFYNAGTSPVDLDGWILVGGIQFVFPAGSIVPPKGYALLARNEAAVRARHDLPPGVVLGEFLGTLDNDGDRLRLLDPTGYVVSFVDYRDSAPWPETPDGLGPSLERVTPALEETDPLSWAASIVVGGTPGRANSTAREIAGGPPPDEIDLVPQESIWRYRRGDSEPPATWAELEFDDASWEKGLAGFGYDDNDDNTVLLDMQGSYSTLYIRHVFSLDDPTTLAAIDFHILADDGCVAYLNGVEITRENSPGDPGDPLPHDALASTTNGPPLSASIDLLPFGDVLRAGDNVLAVQGLNGILESADFTLHPWLTARIRDDEPPPEPAPTRPPRDIVINELLTAGAGTGWVELFNDTGASVDIGGRRLRLVPESRGVFTIPAGTTIAAGSFASFSEAELGFELDGIAALMLTTDDDRWIDGLNPRTTAADHSTGRFPDGDDGRDVFSSPTRDAGNTLARQTGIVIHEIHYHPTDDPAGEEFVELYNRTGSAIDVSNWNFTRGIAYTFPAGTVVPGNGYVVVARDPAAFEARYGFMPLGPWVGALQNDAETLVLRDTLRNVADRVRYADEGSYPEEPDGLGPSLELIHPGLENRYGPAWRASDADGGTPGAPNSRFQSDPAPVLAATSHAPVVPRSTDAVQVRVTISDDSGIDRAELVYRRDGGGGPENRVTLRDDGTQDDGVVGNGIYGAEIPPHPDLTIVRFWVEARSDTGQSVTLPDDPANWPNLYQVENSPLEESSSARREVYRVVMTSSDRTELRTRASSSNELLNSTFIAHGRAYYARGIRLRGNSARRCDPRSYRLQFDHDIDFEGRKRININGCNVERQFLGLDTLRRSNIPTPRAYYRHLTFNTQDDGIHLHVEALDDDFLDRVFPGDSDGNLYRGERQANLDYRGEDFGPYRSNYSKRTNEALDDYSDVVDLCFRFDRDTTSNADFPAAIEERVDVVQWAEYFAVFAVLGSTENSIVLNNGDDYFLYHRFSDNQWILLPWDLDSVFNADDQELFRPTVDQIERFLEHPRYAPDYWCTLERLMESAFRFARVQSRIDHIAPLFSSSLVEGLRRYVGQRRAYIEARIRREISVRADAGGSVCDGVLIPARDTVTLVGDAPGCGTTTVLVNGEPASYNPTTSEWTITLDVGGLESFEIVCLYRTGTEVATLEVPIGSEGSMPTPVPSTISGETTLHLAESPYRAGNLVTVQPGGLLRIEPGVTVLFDADSTLRVEGTLLAEGTADQPIRLRNEPCETSWEGISIRPTSRDSVLRHVDVSGTSMAASSPAGISVDTAELLIEDSVIRDSASTLVWAQDGGTIRLVRTTLENAPIGASTTEGTIVVRDATFRNLTNRALVGRRASLDIDGLLVHDCGTAIRAVDAATATVGHLTVSASTVAFEIEVGPNGPPTVDVHSAILWNNALPFSVDAAANFTISQSNVDSGAPDGDGNISADPAFRDASSNDYRLRAASPCRGTGRDGTDMGAIPYSPVGDVHRFLRCDSNGDATHDISDGVATLLFLFAGGTASPCAIAADCNADLRLDLADAIFGLNHLFTAGAPPPGSYPNCEEAEVKECAAEACATP